MDNYLLIIQCEDKIGFHLNCSGKALVIYVVANHNWVKHIIQ